MHHSQHQMFTLGMLRSEDSAANDMIVISSSNAGERRGVSQHDKWKTTCISPD